MSKPCSICVHKKRCQIDQSYLEMQDIAAVAKKYRVSEDALGRHIRKKHISRVIEAAAIETKTKIGLDIQKCAQEIYDIATGSAQDARSIGQFGAIGGCLGAAAKVLDILNKGPEDRSQVAPKESGYIKGYLGRAEEIYAKTKDQSPSN